MADVQTPMSGLAQFRKQYPQYHDLSDGQLADALHAKSYSDMPRDEFNAKIGLTDSAVSGSFTIDQQRALAKARARQRMAAGQAPDQSASEPPDPLSQARQAMQVGVGPGWAQLGMSPPQASQPVEVELPDGTIAEFPAGTPRDVMQSALRRHFAKPAAAGNWWDDAPVIQGQGQPNEADNWWVNDPIVSKASQDNRDYNSAFYGTGAGAKGFVEGIPIAGPYLEKGVRAAAAGILAPFKDEDFGTIYERLDGMLKTVSDSNVRGVLTTARKGVDAELARAAPGIKGVDAQFAELARQDDALTRGGQLLDTGRNAVRPQELADELLAGSQPRGASVGPSAVPLRLREGARAELDRIVGTNVNDRAALQRLVTGEGDWNPDKLRQLFGVARADRMLGVLRAERTFAETNSAVSRGAASGAYRQADAALANPVEHGLGFSDAAAIGGVTGTALKAGFKATDAVVKAVGKVRNDKAREEIARALISSDPSSIVAALTARAPRTLTAEQQLPRAALTRALLLAPALTMRTR